MPSEFHNVSIWPAKLFSKYGARKQWESPGRDFKYWMTFARDIWLSQCKH